MITYLKKKFILLLSKVYSLRIYLFWSLFFHKVQKDKFQKVRSANLKEWRQKWSVFKIPFSDQSYRLFSGYIGEDVNICPMELVDGVIEPVLNSKINSCYYSNKNIFNKFFPSGWLPTTILRNIHGNFYDKDYQRISDIRILYDLLQPYPKVIVKPALLASGAGVRLFTKQEDGWIDSSGVKLSCSFLVESYGSDYIIQECLSQHSFMASLNPTSVNTIRVVAYRSVRTDEIVIPNVIVRIGKCGACVDNAHAGGVFCGVSEEGVLGRYVCDYLGNTAEVFNGIDFSKTNLQIPDYQEILAFSREVASCIIDQRLLALDIMLDHKGCPRLIEFNVGGFSAWLFQFTNGSVFGSYTDEIIAYCKENVKKKEVYIFR